jgi:hypothetical protein
MTVEGRTIGVRLTGPQRAVLQFAPGPAGTESRRATGPFSGGSVDPGVVHPTTAERRTVSPAKAVGGRAGAKAELGSFVITGQ